MRNICEWHFHFHYTKLITFSKWLNLCFSLTYICVVKNYSSTINLSIFSPISLIKKIKKGNFKKSTNFLQFFFFRKWANCMIVHHRIVVNDKLLNICINLTLIILAQSFTSNYFLFLLYTSGTYYRPLIKKVCHTPNVFFL